VRTQTKLGRSLGGGKSPILSKWIECPTSVTQVTFRCDCRMEDSGSKFKAGYCVGARCERRGPRLWPSPAFGCSLLAVKTTRRYALVMLVPFLVLVFADCSGQSAPDIGRSKRNRACLLFLCGTGRLGRMRIRVHLQFGSSSTRRPPHANQ
jgi:hypothetical protein